MNLGAGPVGRASPTALFIGAVVAVSTIAIGIGLIVFATSGGGRDGGDNAGWRVGDIHHDDLRQLDHHDHDGAARPRDHHDHTGGRRRRRRR